MDYHQHKIGCGHTAILHIGHADFLMEGHLHHIHQGLKDHILNESQDHPTGCVPLNQLSHNDQHSHGPNCGHEPIRHVDHVDYLVDNELHHCHGTHCDKHGMLQILNFEKTDQPWDDLLNCLDCSSTFKSHIGN